MAKDALSITITYAGQLAGEAGVSQETLTVPKGTGVVDLLRTAASRHGGKFKDLLFDDKDALRRALVVSLDDAQLADPASAALTRDHEVFLMTPIAGG